MPGEAAAADMQAPEVYIDQDACTGDGLCAEEAPDVFELDIDGLAYVKGDDGELLTAPGAAVPVPAKLLLDVVESAKRCPGECIYVRESAAS
ncbi:MAG TPA: ferredoxin [Mycobacteriales bacterium]|nr:ferredoxin [Mycobacteriales bacterium]